MALDASFARAWRELGRAYEFMGAQVPEERAVWTNQAVEALARANELMPDSVSDLVGQAEDSISQGECGFCRKRMLAAATSRRHWPNWTGC